MASSDGLPKEVPEEKATRRSPPVSFFRVDLHLRLLLFAASLAALVVVVTSKETKMVPAVNPLTNQTILIPRSAKFTHSTAFIHLVSSLAVTCFHSLVTIVFSASNIAKPSPSTKAIFHFALLDSLMFGVMASATGSSGAVAYVGLKGNEHVNWREVCDIYGKFCRHMGSSVGLSLATSAILLALVILSSYSLYRRTR